MHMNVKLIYIFITILANAVEKPAKRPKEAAPPAEDAELAEKRRVAEGLERMLRDKKLVDTGKGMEIADK